MEPARQHGPRQAVLDGRLDQALQRTRTIDRIEARTGQPVLRGVRDRQRDSAIGQPRRDPGELNVDDVDEVLLRQRVKHHDVVEPVEELRLEGRPHHLHGRLVALLHRQGDVGEELRTEVRGHDQDDVAEVDRAALAVGQASVVQHLQQDVEHVGVCLLHLVQQHHRVGTPPHGLGELAALLVPDVAGRGADQPRDGVLLAVLAHVDADDGALVVEEELGQRLGQFGLADAGRPQEQERSGGAVGIADPGTGAPHSVGDDPDGLLLTREPVPELFLHPHQLLRLALHHASDGDARPAGDDLGDVLAGHLVSDHRCGLAGLGGLLQLRLQVGDLAVQDLGRAGQVSFALPLVGLSAKLVDLGLDVADPVEALLLGLPALLEASQSFFRIGDLGCEPITALLAGGVLLLLQRELLHGHAVHLAAQLIDLLGGGVDLHPQPGRRLVDQVDGLVRKLAARDVAVGELSGGHQRPVGDAHLVVGLVALPQAAQDGDGVLDRRLANQHLLEAPLQGGVLLDVLAVFVQRGRADEAQFAAGQHGLEHVPGVHGSLA